MVPFNYLSVLIMPTDYCNLNCVYCFKDDKTTDKSRKMSTDTLKKVFETIIPYYNSVNFIWHGGEPTSMGIDFYQTALDYQKELVQEKEKNQGETCKIKNTMQSNLTLIDDAFAKFLVANDFKIGGSYDGINNDLTRGCSKQILRGHDLIIQNGGKNSFINVISMKNINSLIEDYEWFKANNINFTMNLYISSHPQNDDLFIPEKLCIQKFTELFDYWIKDKTGTLNIRFFDIILKHVIFNHSSLCAYTSCLGKWVGILYNGDIFPCNRSFPKEYKYGNVWDYDNIRDCFESEGFNRLTAQAVERRKKCSRDCEIFSFCAGGCNGNALSFGGVANNNHYICKILRPMYNYIKEEVSKIEALPIDEQENYNPLLIKMLNEKKEVK